MKKSFRNIIFKKHMFLFCNIFRIVILVQECLIGFIILIDYKKLYMILDYYQFHKCKK